MLPNIYYFHHRFSLSIWLKHRKAIIEAPTVVWPMLYLVDFRWEYCCGHKNLFFSKRFGEKINQKRVHKHCLEQNFDYLILGLDAAIMHYSVTLLLLTCWRDFFFHRWWTTCATQHCLVEHNLQYIHPCAEELFYPSIWFIFFLYYFS